MQTGKFKKNLNIQKANFELGLKIQRLIRQSQNQPLLCLFAFNCCKKSFFIGHFFCQFDGFVGIDNTTCDA